MDSNLLLTDDDDTDQTGCMPMADLSSLGTEAILLVCCAPDHIYLSAISSSASQSQQQASK